MLRVALMAFALMLCALPASANTWDDAVAADERGDYVTAARLIRVLAEQGDVAAQNVFGLMYQHGRGVPQDYAEAVKWYRLAAEQGYAKAQFNLSWKYQLGRGVPQDYVEAHMWFNLAAAKGYAPAEERRETIAKEMTPAQIAEAQRLAQEWTAK